MCFRFTIRALPFKTIRSTVVFLLFIYTECPLILEQQGEMMKTAVFT